MSGKARWTVWGIGLLAILLVACQSGPQQTESETAGTEQGATTRARARAQEMVRITVPAGTSLEVRLGQTIDTGSTEAGTTFEGTLASPLVVNGIEAAAVGSAVAGKVTHVVSSGRLSRPAELSLVLTSLTPAGGKEVAITTAAWGITGESHKKRNIGMIGGGAGAGALVGAIAGGKKGAAIGGAVGAGAGTGVAAATGKKEIQLEPESKVTFKLSEPVTIATRK